MLRRMSKDLSPAPSVVLVGHQTPLLTALSVTLQRAGETAVTARGAASARLILAAAPIISTVICRCHQPGESPDLGLLEELDAVRPDLALIGLCGQTNHEHGDGPPGCHYLVAPYDLDELRRTLAAARLDAYARTAPP